MNMAMSPMMKINIGWGVCFVVGIGSFLLAKAYVVQNRQEIMISKRNLDKKVKEEMEREVIEKQNQEKLNKNM